LRLIMRAFGMPADIIKLLTQAIIGLANESANQRFEVFRGVGHTLPPDAQWFAIVADWHKRAT